MTTAPPETTFVDHKKPACDGGGALGHPKVWLEMGQDDRVDCPYCDRQFIYDPARAAADAPARDNGDRSRSSNAP